jgi:phosphate transport system substrate-binding protein
MTKQNRVRWGIRLGAVITAAALFAPPASSDAAEVRAVGSDTMVELATAWANAYSKINPDFKISVKGGGSGIGLAALQNNQTDIANSSREIKKTESEKVKSVTGQDAKEYHVGYDALAVYTNPRNPIKEISIEELREIWAEGGGIETWDKIDPKMKGKIVLVGRQNSSGTYEYFREHICGKTAEGKQREFRGGVSELNGSAEVVENVIKTRNAIGYSGMGFKTDKVNWLKISAKKGEPAVGPGVDVARSGKYPISRKLYLYTAGEPRPEIKAYIEWIQSPAGQKVVEAQGFVPLN